MEIGGNMYKLINLICLIGMVTCANHYPSASWNNPPNEWDYHYRMKFLYRCQATGEYISDNYFCNGAADCFSGEDEINGCNKSITCDRGSLKKYVCDQQCKELNIRCNGIKDCEDGTDELNCGSGIDVNNCTDESKFLCKDGLRCLELYNTCYGVCNCFDCSDEDNMNCLKEDYNLALECTDSYFTTANGPKCYCNSNNTDFIKFCNRTHSCTNPRYYCQQRCIKIAGKKECACFKGHHRYIHKDLSLEDNRNYNPQCRRNDWWETVVVYATGDEIKLLNVTTYTASTILDEVYNITALAIANNYIYYALKLPNDKGCMFKTSIHSGKLERITETGLKVTSLEVDYITNNLYFTTNGSLSVCKNDGSICLELDSCDVNEVTLAPKSGLMFYLNKKPEQKGFVLTRSSMAGENKITFGEYIYHGDIFSFDVNEHYAMLYLLEMSYNSDNARIHEIPFDSGYPEKTVTTLPVRAFGIYDRRVFFTSWEKRYENFIIFTFSIYLLSQKTWDKGSTPHNIAHNSSASISHLNVHNGILQNSKENPCDKSSCSGLCLLKPEILPKFHLNYTCA